MSSSAQRSRARQQAILDLLLEAGERRVEDLSEAFGVSLATVRRDLAALERRGLAERTWGGARVRSSVRYPESFEREQKRESLAKHAIAALASTLVTPGSTVGLSGGTTCTELAMWLRGRDLTVVTNALNVATELYNHSMTRVIVTGGTLNPYSYELVGNDANRTLERYQVDVCFLGCSGVSIESGFSMRDTPEADVARAWLRTSQRTVVLADSSKIGSRAFARFASLKEIDTMITDDRIGPEDLDLLSGSGLEMRIANRQCDEPDPDSITAEYT